MIYYAIAALAPLLAWQVGESMKKSNRKNMESDLKWLNYLGVLPMLLLFILRDNHVGPDTVGYVKMFRETLPGVPWSEMLEFMSVHRAENGFLIYVKLCSMLTDNYNVFFLINGLIIFGSYMRFAQKYTKNPLLFFYFFVTLGTYSFVLTGLRQALAMAICTWAFGAIKEKKLIRFLLVVWLASLFHKSAMMFALAYPLCRIRRTDYLAFCYIVLCMALVVGFAFFQNVINDWLGYDYGVESTGNGLIFLVMLTAMFFFAVYVMGEKEPGKGENALVFHLSAITVLLWVLRLISRTAERVSYYFIVGLYAYFATAVTVYRDKFVGVIKWFFILASFALLMYRSIGVYYAFFF